MTFSVLIWNVWHINQIEGEAKLQRLLGELTRLAQEFDPDCIVLCEAVQPDQNKLPPVVGHLKKLGYPDFHHAPMVIMESPDYCMSGVAICSKFRLSDKQTHVISKNGSAAKFGYPSFDKSIISATMTLSPGNDIKIIAAHPTATVDGLKPHATGINNLAKLAHSQPFTKNTLLAGDMNQWRFFPGSLRSRLKDTMYSKTGSLLMPTWRYDAHRFTPLRLNLDYIYWSKDSTFRMTGFNLIDTNISDHRPLLATFELKQKAK